MSKKKVADLNRYKNPEFERRKQEKTGKKEVPVEEFSREEWEATKQAKHKEWLERQAKGNEELQNRREAENKRFAQEKKYGLSHPGKNGMSSMSTYIRNAGNCIEGAKFQADKNTPEGRKSAHRQLDGAAESLEKARQIAENDRQHKTGNGLLDFLGLNFDNPSNNRSKPDPEPEPEPPTSQDERSGKTGNGLLDFLGLNFDNPSDNRSKPDPEPEPEPPTSQDERSGKTGNGLLDFLGLNFDNPSDRR